MSDFYCGSCGKHKAIELKRARVSGSKKPICLTCFNKGALAAATSEKRRHSGYARNAKQYSAGKMWVPE